MTHPVRDLPSLTALRWFAALAVFGVHVGVSSPDIAARIARVGLLGVSFFYVLSGFVLAWSHEASDTKRRFYGRRVARIYPTYLTAWLIAAGVKRLVDGRLDIQAFVAGIVPVQSWIPKASIYFGINSPAWSIAVESFFYAVFPVLVVALTRATARHMAMVVGAAWALMALVGATVSATSRPFELTSVSTLETWLVYVFPPVRLLEFMIGCALAAALRKNLLPVVSFRFSACLTVGIYLLVGWGLGNASSGSAYLLVVPFALVIVSAAQRDISGRTTPLNRGGLVRLGQWSFAFYLVHTQVLELIGYGRLHWGLSSVLSNEVVRGLVALALSIAAAAGLHYLIERPFERRIRRRLSPARPLPVSG